MMRAVLAPGDEALRQGGEEFALILKATRAEAATLVCQRLRRRISEHPWRDADPGLSVTISIGIAASVEAPDPVDVMALADRRLYAAKAGGRDRVVDGTHLDLGPQRSVVA